MNDVDDQNIFINFDTICESRQSKEDTLRNFFNLPRSFDEAFNTNKFLFLYGHEDTGKLMIVTQIARELFGSTWRNNIYIRVDDGQQYPYKLHAHKVESSSKVIFITNKRRHWQKWREMYPGTKAYQFTGSEANIEANGNVRLQYQNYQERKIQLVGQLRSDVSLLLNRYKNEGKITEQVTNELQRNIYSLIVEMHQNDMNNLNGNIV